MGKNTKILIADDSEFMRKVLKTILEGSGFSNFIEAVDGKEVLQKIEKEKPDLVLLDLIMPEVGGMEVLKKAGKTVKILVVSAVGQENMVEEAKSYGAVGYIVKPFDRNKVIEDVEKVLG